MTDLSPAGLAELRAVAEAAEPMMVFGGPTQTTFVSVEKQELLALIDALEAKTDELEEARKYRTLPPGYVWQDYYSPDEVIVIRREVEFAIETAERERDEALAEVSKIECRAVELSKRAEKAEAAIERVKALHHDAGESQGYTPEVRGGYGTIPHCCASCGTFGEYGTPWPCETIQAIQGAEG